MLGGLFFSMRPAFILISALVFSLSAPTFAVAQEQESGDLKPKASALRGAILDSINLLLIEHSSRIALQSKTRRELAGPFFKDYIRSLKFPKTWKDGDRWYVNYVGHPIHGAAAGFIWLDQVDGSHDPSLGFSKGYWASRGRATAWAASYSIQFEVGPFSEASIGNVGMHPNTTGWVDHVVTPVGALGFMVAEDALDRFVISRLEKSTSNRKLQKFYRAVMNPSRSLSNASQGRAPWFRAARGL